MFLPILEKDKANHTIYGMVIFAIVYFLFSWQIAIGTVCFFALAKETYDNVSGKGTPDFMDFVYTIAGGLIGLFCVIVK